MSDVKIGKLVRNTKVKRAFDKWSIPNRVAADFLIQSDRSTRGRVFPLIDKGWEELKGSWYPEAVKEIAKIRFLIENLIWMRSPEKYDQEVLVKWNGLAPK